MSDYLILVASEAERVALIPAEYHEKVVFVGPTACSISS